MEIRLPPIDLSGDKEIRFEIVTQPEGCEYNFVFGERDEITAKYERFEINELEEVIEETVVESFLISDKNDLSKLNELFKTLEEDGSFYKGSF